MTSDTAHPVSSNDLVAFVHGVERRSVQAAADDLGLTQSAVTKRIQSLERRLGAQLFERGRFGLRPTLAALRIYPIARQVIDLLSPMETICATSDSFFTAAEETTNV